MFCGDKTQFYVCKRDSSTVEIKCKDLYEGMIHPPSYTHENGKNFVN